jgi:hypothetical protein
MSEIERIDAEHAQLQAQADQTVAALRSLAGKFQAADSAGNPDVREWKLDLREIALAIQAEQQQVAVLMQALHNFVVENADQPMAAAPAPLNAAPVNMAPQYQPEYEQQQPAPRGGLLSRFLGGRFGSAIAQGAGMGLGFGMAEEVIDDIF